MRAIGFLILTSVTSGLLALAVLGGQFRLEVLVGMLGPLAVATGSWWLVERTYTRTPERLTGTMMGAFAVKMVFFAAYVAFALKGLNLRPAPFVVSFTAYFIALHVTEALYMRRLFAGELRGSR
jgi:hypothetical protein